jgi:Fe2+ or Zn2+ uptake regulation protein
LSAVKSPEELTLAFRERGLKVTPQRQAIFRVLHSNGSHPSAEAVHQAVIGELPTVSLRTVYQTLGDLAEMGEILQLDLGTGAARFDPNIDPHHHLVCERCGMVCDTHVDHPDVRPSSPQSDGFRVMGTEIVFRGLCASCAGASTPVR